MTVSADSANLESTGSNVRARSAADLVFGGGLFLVAFLARIVAARTLAAEPVWDGQYYDFGAKRIAAGFGYGDDRVIAGQTVWHPWCHYPVGYSAYLSVFYKLFGTTTFAAHLADALAGSLLALVTYLLARETLSPLRAKIAGGLVALHPGLILYGALVMTEPLAALLTLTAFWAALRAKRSKLFERTRRSEVSESWRPWLVALRGPLVGGVILGIGALVRPQALLCAPFLAVTADVSTLRARLGSAVVACAAALAMVSPWTIRNCRVMDGCALVSTNAGWNLAIGAFPRATGRFETLRSSDGCREVTGQVQQDRCWFDYGVRNIREAPGHWLGLVPAKLGYTFDHESFAVEYLHEARPSSWPEERRSDVRAMVTYVHRLLVVLAPFAFVSAFVGALMGAILEWLVNRRRPAFTRRHAESAIQAAVAVAFVIAGYAAFSAGTPTFWPIVVATCVLPLLPIPGKPRLDAAFAMLLALLGSTVLTHAVFFGEDRYHVVVTPVLCILAAAAFRPLATKNDDARSAFAA